MAIWRRAYGYCYLRTSLCHWYVYCNLHRQLQWGHHEPLMCYQLIVDLSTILTRIDGSDHNLNPDHINHLCYC
ncbi:hypothetical protein RchiOBHm_Chr7g0232311 [Rosa chinensis]|uniref:Uncharacterized protein n=1 Tax=Rosa chinensis TaxID=74649 RepID=A0A2P6PFW3_ROSCH|nr:hypothetical protein RchiOBHm_Chr7g0232311 [Rosa chinensis]